MGSVAYASRSKGARADTRRAGANKNASASGAPAGMPLFLQRAPHPGAATEHVQAKCAECEREEGRDQASPQRAGRMQVSSPDDALEREADATADHVMRMPLSGPKVVSVGSGPAIYRTCAACQEQDEDEGSSTLLTREATAGAERSSIVHPHLESRIDAMRGRGTPLVPAAQAFFEPRFGRDLGNVRVHTDAEAGAMAQALHARAFTVGDDIAFAPGQYAPGSPEGQRLLAHELTHVVQQGAAAAPSRPGTAPPPTTSRTAQRVVQRAWYHRVGNALASGAETVGGALVSGAETVGGALVSGAEWAGGQIASGAEWAGGQIASGAEWAFGGLRDTASAAWGCAQATGQSAAALITGDFDSLSDLLGIPEPAGADPDTLDTVVAAMEHPGVRMLPGSSLLTGAARRAREVGRFLSGAWEMVQNPGPVIAEIRAQLSGYMTAIPGVARGLARQAITFSDPPPDHLDGIWRHLEPKLDYLQEHWWDVLQQMAWDLLWPWPGVGQDLVAMGGNISAAASALWDLEVSTAVDQVLALWRNANSLGGRLYGWFLLASVLVGAIIGAFFGGAGAVPGAGAGFSFATEVGMGLLISTAAADAATIAKSGIDLVFTTQTDEENEEDYELISTSSLSLGILGALFLLGALAARFGKGVISRVAGTFRRRPAAAAGDSAAGAAAAESPGVRGGAAAESPGVRGGTPAESPAAGGGAAAEGAALTSIGESMTLAGRPHRLSIRSFVRRYVLWLCSPVCGELVARCETLLRGELTDAARAEVETVLRRARLCQSRLNSGKMTAAEAEAEVQRLARRLERASAADPDGVAQVVEGEQPAAQAGEVPTEYRLPSGERLSYRGLEPDVPLSRQLHGEGQIAALERNPNISGISAADALRATPRQLAQMVESGRITQKVFNAIMKSGEGRNLRHGN